MSDKKEGQKYFYEDAVWRVEEKGNLRLGMVIETCECSQDDDSSDDEDQVAEGDVRVAWYPSGREEVLSEDKINLSDRSLMPGDIVRKISDKTPAERGFCRNVHVDSTVEIVGTKQVVSSVSTLDLEPIEKLENDLLVCKDGWVGAIRSVTVLVKLRFPDSSEIVVDNSTASELEDILNSKDHDTEFKRYDFYPGQLLHGQLSDLAGGQWLHCSPAIKAALKNRPHKSFRMTVVDARVDQLNITWLCNSDNGTDRQVKQPDSLIQKEDVASVRILNFFEPCTMQMGDRSFYVVKEADVFTKKSKWKRNQLRRIHGRTESNSEELKDEETDDELEVDEATGSTSFDGDQPQAAAATGDAPADDDGTDGEKASAATANAAGSSGKAVGGLRKKAGKGSSHGKPLKKSKSKLAKRAPRETKVDVVPQTGMRVVTETLATQSKVDIVWQSGRVDEGVPSAHLFPVQHLDDHEFFPGDFVIEAKEEFKSHTYGVIQDVDYIERSCNVKWFQTFSPGASTEPSFLKSSEDSVYDLKDHPDFQYRPGTVVIRVSNQKKEACGLGAGQVIHTDTSGRVNIWWANQDQAHKVTSACWPQEIFKVGEYDSDDDLWDNDDDGDDFEDGEGSDEDSWATESEHDVNDDDEIDESQDAAKNATMAEVLICQQAVKFCLLNCDILVEESSGADCLNLVQEILGLVTLCKTLDRLLESDHFKGPAFDEMLEKLRSKEKFFSFEQAVNSHKSRFGAAQSEPTASSSPSSSSQSEPTASSSPSSSSHSEPTGSSSTSSSSQSEPTASSSPSSSSQSESSQMQAETKVGNGSKSDGDHSYAAKTIYQTIKTKLKLVDEEIFKRYGEQNFETAMGEAKKNCGSDGELLANLIEKIPIAKAEKIPIVKAAKAAFEPYAVDDNDNQKSDKNSPITDDTQTLATPPTTPHSTTPLSTSLGGSFELEESVPSGHHFNSSAFLLPRDKTFLRRVAKEIGLLRSSLPAGITVKSYEARADLFSAMIEGPANTPYENGLFLFDFQLGPQYPEAPPLAHYVSYCADRLNPNLYEDGKVCVSLLGTWNGKGSETWTSESNLLQLLVSIQGLILVREPYFNEAGYERHKGTQEGAENSRHYNEMVLLKLLQSMTRLIENPPQPFAEEIRAYCKANAPLLIERLERWTGKSSIPSEASSSSSSSSSPDFPLLPVSKGFCISIQKALQTFKAKLS